MKIFLIQFFAFLFLFQMGQKMRTTQPTNYLREGPASYYDVISTVSGGTEVGVMEKKGTWLKVKVENDQGWISENSFAQKAANKNDELTKGKASSRASRAELAAAVKGFAKKYVDDPEGGSTEISKFSGASVKAEDMEQFEHSFTIEPFRGYMNIEKPFDLRFYEEGIGLGIAQKIARAKGIVKEPRTTLYLNLIGNYLSKFTKAYDLGFRFYILNDEKASAFACPGGYIFISKGMIQACTNEAELAAVLAHEMTHVTQRHGLKELKLSEPKIKAEQAFAELEEETGDEKSEEEKDLENYADNAYENLISPRLLEYEIESDKLCMVFLKRAGYDPTALLSVLQKFQSLPQEQKDIFDANYMKKNDLRERFLKIQQVVRSEGYRSNEEKQFRSRFQSYTTNLQ